MTVRKSTGALNKTAGIHTELFTDGTFSDDPTGYMTATNATLTSETGGQSGNCLQVLNAAGSAVAVAYKDFTTVVGQRYGFDYYFKKGTSATGSVQIGITTDANSIYTSLAHSDADWTQYNVSFTATATTTRISFISDSTTISETSLFDEANLYKVYGGVREVFKDSKLYVYNKAQEASPNTGIASSYLVVTYSDAGGSNGIDFDSDPVAGVLTATTASIQGTAVGGTAVSFLLCESGDDPTVTSTTAARLSGTIGTTTAYDLQLSSTTIAASSVQTLSSLAIDVT